MVEPNKVLKIKTTGDTEILVKEEIKNIINLEQFGSK
jgi:hypothetical protein